MPIINFSIFPLAGSTQVLGTANNDTLAGFLGDDTISGGGGDDVFFEGRMVWSVQSTQGFNTGQTYDFGSGNDVISGGAGQDWLLYTDRLTRATLDLSNHSVSFGAEHDSFSSIEAFTLGDNADRVIGRQAGVGIDLGNGNDTMNGASGFATAFGGYGRDLLLCSDATVAVSVDMAKKSGPNGAYIDGFEDITGALRFSNYLKADLGNNMLAGGNLSDTLLGLSGKDTLYGGDGNDSLYGGDGADDLEGGLGNDVITDSYGDDRFVNAGGDDTYFGGGGNDTLIGGDQQDHLFGGGDEDVIFGNGGDDSLFGYWQNDTIYGGAGNDRLDGGQGINTLSGGDGADTLIGGTEGDLLYGGAMNDRLIGGEGTDLLYGGDGDDTLSIEGRDLLDEKFYGGAGNDTILLLSASSYSQGQLGAGNDLVNSPTRAISYLDCGDGDDRVSLSSGKVLGENGNDQITLADGTITGGAGNDTLSMTLGHTGYGSSVLAGSGNDIVILGKLADPNLDSSIGAVGGTGYDILRLYHGSYLVSETPIYVDGFLTTVSGFEEIQILDTDVNVRYIRSDTQTGFGATNDVLTISAGSGTYTMGAGNDDVTIRVAGITLDTGDGDDAVYAAKDVQDVTTGAGNDGISLDGNGNVSSGAGNDSLYLHGNGLIDAGAGDDRLQLGDLWVTSPPGEAPQIFTNGNLASSTVHAGAGNDTVIVKSHPLVLDLGDGNDRVSVETYSPSLWSISGGAGADHFQFRDDVTKSNVTITDFDPLQDKLALEGVAKLSDLDSVTVSGTGVHIVEGKWSIYLPTVTLDMMATVKFVGLQYDI